MIIDISIKVFINRMNIHFLVKINSNIIGGDNYGFNNKNKKKYGGFT